MFLNGLANHLPNGNAPQAAGEADDAPNLQIPRSQRVFDYPRTTGQSVPIYRDSQCPYCPDARNKGFVSRYLGEKVLVGIDAASSRVGFTIDPEDRQWLIDHDGRFMQFQHDLDPNAAHQRSKNKEDRGKLW